jgi:hypothetical protein
VVLVAAKIVRLTQAKAIALANLKRAELVVVDQLNLP